MDDVEKIAKDVTDKDKSNMDLCLMQRTSTLIIHFYSHKADTYLKKKDGFNTNDVAVNDPSVVKMERDYNHGMTKVILRSQLIKM